MIFLSPLLGRSSITLSSPPGGGGWGRLDGPILLVPQLAESRTGQEQDQEPRSPGGAHPAHASPGLSCASRACRDMVGQESPDNTWQSF